MNRPRRRPRSNRSRYLNSSRVSRSRSWRCLRSAAAAAERLPSFHRARRHRSSPSAVRGPVDAPPCIRHLVYSPVFLLRIAGALHKPPLLAFAPHRGAIDGFPVGLPFSRRPGALFLITLSSSRLRDERDLPEVKASLRRRVTRIQELSPGCFQAAQIAEMFNRSGSAAQRCPSA
jgi:hypothetical protein